jgi:hypothetical protein
VGKRLLFNALSAIKLHKNTIEIKLSQKYFGGLDILVKKNRCFNNTGI